MYDYGNARVAGLRSWLLAPPELWHLADAGSAAAFLAALARHPDWRAEVEASSGLAIDPWAGAEAAIERHRASRLAALPAYYPGRARRLVEALVLGLDAERVLAIVRRRQAGETPEAIGPSILPGALLGPAELGLLARAPDLAKALAPLEGWQLVGPADAAALGRLIAAQAPWSQLEGGLARALGRARLARAAGRRADAVRTRAWLSDEAAARAAAAADLERLPEALAAEAEPARLLARLDRLAASARHDPLGIGAVAGYVAAVEAQAIRLRAALAGAAGGWGHGLVGRYLTVGPA
jgi:vacuolar-type H+-ATPase subunit C/Vma6